MFDYLAQHPGGRHAFDAAMSERTAAFAPSVAAGYDFSDVRTVVDVGGGKGTLLVEILRQAPAPPGRLCSRRRPWRPAPRPCSTRRRRRSVRGGGR